MATQTPHPVYQRMRDAAAYVRVQIETRVRDAAKREQLLKPRVGLVLGSGLGAVADQISDALDIPYETIPGFHRTAVEGHPGRMVVGFFAGVPVICLQGRFHRYEGYSMEQVVLPTRVLAALGIKTLVLTNAAGGVNTAFRAGDIMLITDHLNLTGDNPLIGPNLAELGPRFPDMSEAYSADGLRIVEQAAKELQIPLKHGVYAGLLGPTYETPAEIRMFRILGADAVGMSTVSETIAAQHLGVRVVGLSCITNLGSGLSPRKLTHQEVIDNSKLFTERLTRLLTLGVPKLA